MSVSSQAIDDKPLVFYRDYVPKKLFYPLGHGGSLIATILPSSRLIYTKRDLKQSKPYKERVEIKASSLITY